MSPSEAVRQDGQDGSAGSRAPAERLCAGCRQRDDRDDLMRLRLLGDPPSVVPDVRRRGPGRGVSVHPRRACLERAVQRGALRRAFRRELQVDADQIAQWAIVQYERRVEGLLLGAQRGGLLALGSEAARSALARTGGSGRSRAVALLVVAHDAAPSREELRRMAERLGRSCLVYGDKQMLGKLFGREELAVIAVLDAAVGRELCRAAQGATGLAEAS